MIKALITLLLTLSLAACDRGSDPSDEAETTSPDVAQESASAPSELPLSESERLNQWFDEKYEEELQFSPMMLTFLGRKDRYAEVDSMTEDAELAQLAWRKSTIDQLKAEFDYAKLSASAKASYDLWIYQYEEEKAGAEFMGNAYVFHQMNGVQAFLPQFMINFHKVNEASDMEAYIKRIDGLGRAIGELLERAKRYAKNGVRPPKFAYDGVLEQASNIVTGQPFSDVEDSSPLWSDVNSKVDALLAETKISETEAENFKKRARQALLGQFHSAYKDLILWVEEELPKADVIATGVGKRDNGTDYYNHQLKVSTTTDMSADEVHQLGLKEVERLVGEMEAIKNKVGFKGSLQQFFSFIKNDDQFFYPNTDEGRLGYIRDTEVFLDYINQRLPDYFGILPKADLVVKRVEAFREQDGAAQHYFPGTPDGSRPGIYYAHLSDMRAMPKPEMEAIAYHEGNPGHHMQISIAQELESVPEFRKQARFTAYSEGWALYAELLAKEMGAYQDDYNDFGRLITEMWRAVRLVVDTGLHAKGWTESEAIEYFKANAPVADEAVTSEVRRYIVWPGQATAYKIGMIKIQEMRALAEKELGDQFDIRRFHDIILGSGALPMAMLEEAVRQWIENTKNT